MSANNTKKISGKDLINIGIYTVLYFVILSVAGALGYIPIFIPLMAIFVPLLGGIPFMLFLTKVNKFGMLLIMGTLIGILMFVGGMGYWTLPVAIVTSLFAELVLKSGAYKSAKKSVLTCGVFNLWILGNFVPFYIGAETYYATLTERFGLAYAETLRSFMPLWVLPILVVVAFAFGIIGGLIGRALCKKHFQRAGIL